MHLFYGKPLVPTHTHTHFGYVIFGLSCARVCLCRLVPYTPIAENCRSATARGLRHSIQSAKAKLHFRNNAKWKSGCRMVVMWHCLFDILNECGLDGAESGARWIRDANDENDSAAGNDGEKANGEFHYGSLSIQRNGFWPEPWRNGRRGGGG